MLIPEQENLLRNLAHYIWWQPPEESLKDPERLVAQVMDIGSLPDVCRLMALFPNDYLRTVINHAVAGWFKPQSWHFWHYKLGITPVGGTVPPLPERNIVCEDLNLN